MMQVWFPRRVFAVGGICVLAVVPELVSAENVRIVTYNLQADVSSPAPSAVLPVVSTVMEGIGQQKYAGDGILQLPDVIALQETTSNATTVAPIVSNLNTYYGKNLYNYSSYQATTSDGVTTGGGPNALIYNQTTMNLLASVGVGTPASGTNGEFRQVVRYEFQPLVDTGTSNGIFYIYDSHAKSGSAGTSADGSTDGACGRGEAQIVRNDETANLPANAAVMYVGDWNMDGTTETAYQTLTAQSNVSGGKVQGAGVDPDNVANNYNQNWSSSSFDNILTDSDFNLEYRDDLQLMTGNVYNGTSGSLNYVPGSLHSFGNNGTTPYETNTNQTGNSSLNDIVGNGPLTVSQVLASLNKSTGSDHLPVVADFTITTQANGIWLGGNGNWSTAADWSNSVVPNSSTVEVKIANSSSTVSVVTLDQNETAEDVTLDAIDTLQISAGKTLTLAGPNASTFNGTFSSAGGFSTASPVVNAGTFSSTGTFSATGNFTNGGTVVLGGTQFWSTGSAYNNTAGKTTFLTDPGTVSASPLAVLVTGGTVTFGPTAHVASLNVASGETVSLSISTTVKSVLVTGGLSDAGTIDIGTSAVDLTATGGMTAVTNLAAAGYAHGKWNGTGITSTTAAADTSNLTAVGVIQNNQSGSPLYTAATPFDGVVPGVGDTLAMYTYYGDANLDGKIDGSDYSLIDAGYSSLGTLTGWYYGDFNYDGVIDGSDYALMDNAFNNQTANLSTAVLVATETALPAGPTSTVPEPALGVAAITAAGVIGRRRRN